MAPVVTSPYREMSSFDRRSARIPDPRKQQQALPDYGPDDYQWHELWDSLNDRVIPGLYTKVNGHIYKVEYSFYIQAYTAARDQDRLDERAGEKDSMIELAEGRIAQEPSKAKKTAKKNAKNNPDARAILRKAMRGT